MQFDFTLQAGQSQHIDTAGTFVKYKAGTGLIRVRLNSGGYIDLLPGQGVNNVQFNNIDVQDRTGAVNAGTILAGVYDFRDDRITGTVDVVDGGYARTLAGKAFMGAASNGADAAKVSGSQVWNPPGSGKNLIVKRYSISSGAGGGMHVRLSQQMLAQQNNNGYAKNPLIPDSLAQIRVDKLVGVASYFIGNKMDQYSIPVNGSITCVLQEPIMVPPGYGMLMHALTENVDLTASYEWYEERI